MADNAKRGAGPAYRVREGSWLPRRTARGELSLRGRGLLDQDARAGPVQIYSRGADRLALRMVSARAQEAARLFESPPRVRGVPAEALRRLRGAAGGGPRTGAAKYPGAYRAPGASRRRSGSGAGRVRAGYPCRSLSAQKLSALDENFLTTSHRAESLRRQFSRRSLGQGLSGITFLSGIKISGGVFDEGDCNGRGWISRLAAGDVSLETWLRRLRCGQLQSAPVGPRMRYRQPDSDFLAPGARRRVARAYRQYD